MPISEPALLTDNPMVDNFYDNTQSNVIRITDDKLKVILLENKEGLRKQNDFVAPLTLLISIILTFCTTDFRAFLAVEASVWKALYIFFTIGSVTWLVIELKHISKTVTIDQLMEQIRRQRPPTTTMKLSNIIIHSAIYGAENKRIDLTAQVNALVSQNIFEILSCNELGGDPLYGKRKTLSVDCTINGTRKTLTAIEGSTLKLE